MVRTCIALLCGGAVALLMVGSAFGICEDVENGIGVYFDAPAYEENCATPAVGTPFSLYFVLRNCTLETAVGFAFAWRLAPEPDPAPFNLGITSYPCLNMIDGDPDDGVFCYCAGGQGFPTTGTTLLASVLLVFPAAPGETFVQVGPAETTSPPSYPAIFTDVVGEIVPLHFCGGGEIGDVTRDADGWSTPGVAVLKGECTSVAAEGQTWGSVKALYR